MLWILEPRGAEIVARLSVPFPEPVSNPQVVGETLTRPSPSADAAFHGPESLLKLQDLDGTWALARLRTATPNWPSDSNGMKSCVFSLGKRIRIGSPYSNAKLGDGRQSHWAPTFK